MTEPNSPDYYEQQMKEDEFDMNKALNDSACMKAFEEAYGGLPLSRWGFYWQVRKLRVFVKGWNAAHAWQVEWRTMMKEGEKE